MQKQTDNEEMKSTGEFRQRRQGQGTGFWQRSRVGTVQEISHVNSQNNKYIILNCRTSKEKKELNMQADIKMKNGKKLKVKVLVDSGCTHTRIDE